MRKNTKTPVTASVDKKHQDTISGAFDQVDIKDIIITDNISQPQLWRTKVKTMITRSWDGCPEEKKKEEVSVCRIPTF